MAYSSIIPKMTKFKANKDCFCEHYLHEKTNYPRAGLAEKKLNEGDEVEFICEWSNLYGTYFRVEKDGTQYDIKPNNLDKIKVDYGL